MGYIIRIFHQQQFSDMKLDAVKRIAIGSGPKNDVVVAGEGIRKTHLVFIQKKDVWYAVAKGKASCNKARFQKIKVEHNQTFVLHSQDKIAISVFSERGIHPKKIDLTMVETLTLGRSKANQVVFADPRVSSGHAKIYKVGAHYHICDANSTNGTYVNNHQVQDVMLQDNDEIAIGQNSLVFTKDTLYFKNVNQGLHIHNISLKRRGLKKIPQFKRSPRLKLEVPTGEIVIQEAPSISTKPEINWAAVLLPALGMIGVMLLVTLVTLGNLTMLLYTGPMAVIGVIVSIINYNAQKKKYKRQIGQRFQTYADYIASMEREIEKNIRDQQSAMAVANPDTGVCFRVARNIERRLWERKPSDDDFASFRLGSGDTDFSMEIKIPNVRLTLEEDRYQQFPRQLQEKYAKISGIPVNFDASTYPTCGIVGERSAMLHLVKNMIVQAVTHHSYDELKLVTLFRESERKDFAWMRWLPHSFDNQREMRYMATTQGQVSQLLAHFEAILKSRAQGLSEHRTYHHKNTNFPFYLFVISHVSLVEKQMIMQYLVENDPQMGIGCLFLFDELGMLPHACSTIIDVKGTTGTIYHRDNVAVKTAFRMDDTSKMDFDQFARDLMPIQIALGEKDGTLPSSVTFLEGYGVQRPEEIPMVEHWRQARPYDTLAVPIATKANGKPFVFDIHERAHGPHGLVAGTTGSGKSEMVQSWILSMALHFSPAEIAFVLIDFKGTGLIHPFVNLPHLAGTISDLDCNIMRNLIALENELSRRKELLDRAGVNNINAYVKLRHEGSPLEPMPYLFIVIDEFAEFKAMFPSFGASIDSILRTGRTLGVFSILLTQKPTGVVTDQSEANVKFKWCLKVANPGDSREMINTADAAQISNPGRAYVKVSNEGATDYVYELVQSYWSGAPYDPNRTDKNQLEPTVSALLLNGVRQSLAGQVHHDASDLEEQEITAIVTFIKDTAVACNIPSARPVWNEKLPDSVYLEGLHHSIFQNNRWDVGISTLQAAIGLVDNPKNQAQYPLGINFSQDGHTAIYGAPGTGKTTLLQTLALSICTSYCPDQVSVYIMDFGGWNMGVLRNFPHVGDVVNDNESEKVEKLVRMFTRELSRRKQKFSQVGLGNITAYREATGEKIPYLLLMLDNFAPVLNIYPELDEFFISLTREGGNYGIYFIATTTSALGLGYKIGQNIKNILTLQLSDRSEYSNIVGRTNGLEPENLPGRGLVKGETPMEFQTALPIQGASESGRVANMQALAQSMCDHWHGTVPAKIPTMPEFIPFGTIPTEKIALGLSFQDIEPVELDFETSNSLLIAGKYSSGKSNMLKVIAKQMTPVTTLAFDFDGSLASIAGDGVEHISSAGAFDNAIAALIPTLESRRTAYQQDNTATFPLILIVIDDLKQCFDGVTNETIARLHAITRIGKGLNVVLLVAGMFDDVSKLYNQGEQLTGSLVSGQQCILLGGCANDYEGIKIGNLTYGEKTVTVGAFEGFYINREVALRMKTMGEQ